MRVYYRILVSFFVIAHLSVRCQPSLGAYIESPLQVTSQDADGNPIRFFTPNAKLILNTSTGYFLLITDISKLKASEIRIDTLLKKQTEQKFEFAGRLSEDIPTFNQHVNDGNNYELPGTITLNGVSHPCIAEYNVISLAERSDSKNFRMNFRLTADAVSLNVKGLEGVLKKQISFEISGGMLNIQN